MASRSLNRVELIGHLGKDADTKFTQSGTAVSTFSVATTRRFKQGDEWKDETDWHNIVLWKQENLANYLQKGKQVFVAGRLQTRSYENKDGVKVYTTEVVADDVILLGGGGQREDSESRPAAARKPVAKPVPVQNVPDGGAWDADADNEVPF